MSTFAFLFAQVGCFTLSFLLKEVMGGFTAEFFVAYLVCASLFFAAVYCIDKK